MLTKLCEGHNVEMLEKVSKTKYDEHGNAKHYFSHIGPDGKFCFGIKKIENPPVEKEDFDGGINDEQEKELDELFKEDIENDEVEDTPMTRLDWNEKEFIKGLGVYSSPARNEGMTPLQASETMHLWDWMFLSYGDMPGYKVWEAKAKKRLR